MKKRLKILNSKAARSLFFIGFVGGLFLFSSIVFEHLCNKMIFDTLRMPCINTLEAAGIIAFGYILFMGIRFGLKWRQEFLSERQKTKCQSFAEMSLHQSLQQLTPEDKQRLKDHLKRGFARKDQNAEA